jgi:hypothetical protein
MPSAAITSQCHRLHGSRSILAGTRLSIVAAPVLALSIYVSPSVKPTGSIPVGGVYTNPAAGFGGNGSGKIRFAI